MSKLTIGQMSRENGISEQTLRLYDKMGLFSPVFRDENTGYRYYDVRQSAKLDIIQYFKSIGLTLNEIKEQLNGDDISKIRKLLETHLTGIDEKIKHLELQKDFIKRTTENFKIYEDKPPANVVFLETFPYRYIYVKDLKQNFYNHPLEVYEKLLREFKQEIITHTKSPIYFTNIGTIIRQNDILKGNIKSTEFFIFTKDDEKQFPTIQTVEGGYYLCIYCYNFDDEIECINKLMQYIKKENLRIVGDYMCEVLADLPELNNTSRGMFLRLQIPVSFC